MGKHPPNHPYEHAEVEAEGAHAKVLFVALPGGDPLSNSMVATPAPVIAEDPETEVFCARYGEACLCLVVALH